MLQIGNKPIDTMYVGGKLVQKAYLGSKKVYPEHGVIPKSIKDSMVLWYDLKRQGATNESMAADPTLCDLSGNGHDATCYNFAWSGMSGIGGYGERDFSDVKLQHTPENDLTNAVLTKYSNTKFRLTTTTLASIEANYRLNMVEFYRFNNNTYTDKWIVKVTGIKPNSRQEVAFFIHNNISAEIVALDGGQLSDNNKNIMSDGIYEVKATLNSNTPDTASALYQLNIKCDAKEVEEYDITVELLPQYPHALVSDGVDDYAVARQLPILTKETGYTIMLKRKILTFNVEGYNWAVASNRNTGRETGAFCFEKYTGNSNEFGYNNLKTLSFGSGTVVSEENPVEQITWQTSASYNGKPLTTGTSTGSPILILCGNSQDANGNNSFENSNIVLYSALLFNRDLTVDEINWVKTNLIEGNDDDADWYGVEFYTTSPNPDCIRIGNPELHKTLPVHSQMKGVLLADDGTENKMLNESDWTSETLDGSQGQSMVRVPKQSYWRFETDGNIRRVKFSTKPLPGFKPTPQGYVSAYEAALQRSTNKLASVVNTDADYRGGNNNSGWDGTYRSLLGMPATNINRTNFRTYARNRKADSTEWNMMTYDMQKLLYWLFVVEYATLNTQKAFNPDKDSNGYAQGGLGNGVTNLNTGNWNSFNGYNPFIPCGYTNSLGNGTGQIAYTMPFEYEVIGAANYAGEYSAETAYTDGQFVSQGEDLYECIADAAAGTALTDTTYFTKVTRTVTYVPRYRGIENPFGHQWQWTDGINIRTSPTAENGGDNLSKVYVCSDPDQFKDNGYDGYTYVGDAARTEQYVKEVIFGEGGEIIPKVVGDGASSTTYVCDYFYTNIPSAKETLRVVIFGGYAHYGARAGFAGASSAYVPANWGSYVGSRLCFIPNNND